MSYAPPVSKLAMCLKRAGMGRSLCAAVAAQIANSVGQLSKATTRNTSAFAMRSRALEARCATSARKHPGRFTSFPMVGRAARCPKGKAANRCLIRTKHPTALPRGRRQMVEGAGVCHSQTRLSGYPE